MLQTIEAFCLTSGRGVAFVVPGPFSSTCLFDAKLSGHLAAGKTGSEVLLDVCLRRLLCVCVDRCYVNNECCGSMMLYCCNHGTVSRQTCVASLVAAVPRCGLYIGRGVTSVHIHTHTSHTTEVPSSFHVIAECGEAISPMLTLDGLQANDVVLNDL